MTTAIIGTGGLGSVIARRLASGGEHLRLSSADLESARKLAAEIGPAAVAAAGAQLNWPEPGEPNGARPMRVARYCDTSRCTPRLTAR